MDGASPAVGRPWLMMGETAAMAVEGKVLLLAALLEIEYTCSFCCCTNVLHLHKFRLRMMR
jgi:hypothetical protein